MTTHVLYRMFTADERLLYVGLTCNPPARFRQHRGASPWWSDVANIRLEHFATHQELVQAEQAAIQAEKPVYNVARYSGQRERREPPMVPISALRTILGWSLSDLAGEVAKHLDHRPSTYTLCAFEIGHPEAASPELLAAAEAAYGLDPGAISTTFEPREVTA